MHTNNMDFSSSTYTTLNHIYVYLREVNKLYRYKDNN